MFLRIGVSEYRILYNKDCSSASSVLIQCAVNPELEQFSIFHCNPMIHNALLCLRLSRVDWPSQRQATTNTTVNYSIYCHCLATGSPAPQHATTAVRALVINSAGGIRQAAQHRRTSPPPKPLFTVGAVATVAAAGRP